MVDAIISAEIFPEDNPILGERVLKNMIHHCITGRCKEGAHDQCKKNFPYPLREATVFGEGYPKYRRRPLPEQVMSGNRLVDNTLVVPYNATLMKKYDCHINVECVSSLRVLAYLFKYLYNDQDRINVATVDGRVEVNQIESYIQSHYTSAIEAAWRLFEYPMHARSIGVYRLSIHLPGQQTVFFPENANAEQLEYVLNRAKDTTFMAFFKLNQTDPHARTLLYSETLKHYVFIKSREEDYW